MKASIVCKLFVTVLFVPAIACGAFTVESVFQATLKAPVLAVAAHPENELLFVLTKGEVLIYATDEQKVVDRIAVDASIDGLAYQQDDRLILTATDPPLLSVLQISQVFQIDIEGRAFKGPPDARATIVVFDDYQ